LLAQPVDDGAVAGSQLAFLARTPLFLEVALLRLLARLAIGADGLPQPGNFPSCLQLRPRSTDRLVVDLRGLGDLAVAFLRLRFEQFRDDVALLLSREVAAAKVGAYDVTKRGVGRKRGLVFLEVVLHRLMAGCQLGAIPIATVEDLAIVQDDPKAKRVGLISGPGSPASGQFLSRTLPRRLPLTADGPEFGQGLGPALGVGLQDQCLLAELSRLDAPAFDFVVERLPANAITCAKLAHCKCFSGREIHACLHLG